MKPTPSQLTIPNLVNTAQQLSTSLQAFSALSLDDKSTAQLISYTLIATAVVGILVYHYLQQQDNL